jgi:hypothetical protein
MKRMTAPIQEDQDSVSRWTAQTVGMDWEILDRMERGNNNWCQFFFHAKYELTPIIRLFPDRS